MVLTQDDLDAIALAVKTSLAPELAIIQEQIVLVREVHRLLGLDPQYPLIVTQIERNAGDIKQTITLNPATQTTIVQRVIQGVGVGNDIVGFTRIGNGLPSSSIGALQIGQFTIN